MNTSNILSVIMFFSSVLIIVVGAVKGERVLSNIQPVDSLVQVTDDEACYKYLGWQNAHILKDMDTGALTSVYTRPIIQVNSCEGSKIK